MTRTLGRRLLLLVPTLGGVLVAAFVLLNVAPGDPVQAMVGERADSATIARLRAELHLDDPLPVRFGRYVMGLLHGDLGRSYITGRPIAQDLAERFPKTAQLALAAMSFAATLGITLGVVAAVRPGGWADRLARLTAYLGVSFPVYWVGLLLVLLFAVTLHWLPPSGSGGLAYLVLPAATLGMRSVAVLARMTRGAMREALASDFTRTARAKGAPEHVVVLRHALRNALIAPFTIIALQLNWILSGVVVVEVFFEYAGFGKMLLDAALFGDVYVIQAATLVAVFVAVVSQIISDVGYTFLNPRIRFS